MSLLCGTGGSSAMLQDLSMKLSINSGFQFLVNSNDGYSTPQAPMRTFLKKFDSLVVFYCQLKITSNITKNTNYQFITIPEEARPKLNSGGIGSIIDWAQGKPIGNANIWITTTGASWIVSDIDVAASSQYNFVANAVWSI